MATINEVAKLAGVAPITASRVINHSGYYSEKVRERVENAIAKLGYVPNTIARSLRSKHTQTLALVVTDITNPFFTLIARGVEDAASDAQYMVIFCNSDESESEESKYLSLLLQKQVDGILLVPTKKVSGAVRMIQERGIPIVLLDRRLPDVDADIVRCDTELGAYQLVRLLIADGHQRIAIISGPEGTSTADDRLAGYCRALDEAKLGYSDLVFRGSFNQENGYIKTLEILKLTPPPSAIFASNNFIAIGAMKALRAARQRVPEDISLVACDDLPEAMTVDPILTVVAQPAYQMGYKAAQLLLSRLKGTPVSTRQELLLPTEIIIRRSNAPAQKTSPIFP